MAFCELHYWSNALGKQTACNVIFPQKGIGPFPVFYLLHGYSDDHSMWMRRSSIERHVENLPLIVVMPDGGKSFYCDAAEGVIGSGIQGDAYETSIVRDLVDFVDSRFNTRDTRDGRVIGGLSMGGYGAFKLALKYPNLFCAAVSHSGAVSFAHQDPQTEEWRTSLCARILGDDTAKWAENDIYALSQRVSPEERPALRFDCGVDDFLIEHNRNLHAHLERHGIPHEYQEFPGGHEWSYWDEHVQEALAFFKPHLGIEG